MMKFSLTSIRNTAGGAQNSNYRRTARLDTLTVFVHFLIHTTFHTAKLNFFMPSIKDGPACLMSTAVDFGDTIGLKKQTKIYDYQSTEFKNTIFPKSHNPELNKQKKMDTWNFSTIFVLSLEGKKKKLSFW